MGIDAPLAFCSIVDLEDRVLREAFDLDAMNSVRTRVHEAVRIAADPVQIPRRGLLLLRDGVGQCFEGPADLLGGLALLL